MALIQDFHLTSLSVNAFHNPILIILSSICWCSANNKRSQLEFLLPSNIKPNATYVLLFNDTIWKTNKEKDVLFIFEEDEKARHNVNYAGTIFQNKRKE